MKRAAQNIHVSMCYLKLRFIGQVVENTSIVEVKLVYYSSTYVCPFLKASDYAFVVSNPGCEEIVMNQHNGHKYWFNIPRKQSSKMTVS